MKRIVSLACCLIMLFTLLAGCNKEPAGTPTSTPPPTATSTTTPTAAPQPTNSNPAPPPQLPTNSPPPNAEFVEHLVITSQNNIAILDPHNSAGSSTGACLAYLLIHDTLVEYDDGKYVPRLATSWETKDCQTYKFKLRNDAVFHNGEKFTAADVAFTIERAKAAQGTLAFNRFSNVETCNIISDYEIELVLKKVNVDFIAEIAYPYCVMLNKKAIESDPDLGPRIGTGRWIVTDFLSNEYAEFERNENYWGEIPKTKKLTVRPVAEASARLIMLENAEAHVAYDINPLYFPDIEADPRFTTYSFLSNNTQWLAFNMNDPLMADLNFRMAVAHALKREDCVIVSRNGYAIPVDSGTFWGYATEFKNTDIPIIPYDLKKAKEYLALSGYNGETISITAAIAEMIKNAEVIQSNLEEIGVKATIYETDGPGMSSVTAWGNDTTQLISFSGGWQFVGSAARSYYYPKSANNKANYDNPEITKLFDEAGTIIDAKAREAVYRKIQELVSKDIPYLGIYNARHVVCCQNGVDGLKLTADMSMQDLSYVYMVKP